MSTTRITSQPDIMTGKPCIDGTRITVEYILELLEGGHPIQEIVAEHPVLTREGVEAAIPAVTVVSHRGVRSRS